MGMLGRPPQPPSPAFSHSASHRWMWLPHLHHPAATAEAPTPHVASLLPTLGSTQWETQPPGPLETGRCTRGLLMGPHFPRKKMYNTPKVLPTASKPIDSQARKEHEPHQLQKKKKKSWFYLGSAVSICSSSSRKEKPGSTGKRGRRPPLEWPNGLHLLFPLISNPVSGTKSRAAANPPSKGRILDLRWPFGLWLA